MSGAFSCQGSSSAGASDPLANVPRSTASIAPAMDDQLNSQFGMFRDFLAYMERQQGRPTVMSLSVSSFAPVQSAERLIYTAAPSDRPYSAVGYPLILVPSGPGK